MQADTELNLGGVPVYDGTPGYNVEEFEGKSFLSVPYQTVELGSDAQALFANGLAAGDSNTSGN